jgi:predicted nucleotidyltransferase
MGRKNKKIIIIGLLFVAINLPFSILPGGVEAGTTPPGAITNLSALTGDNVGEINLSWTAPGDDNYENPIVAGKYRIDYSTYPLYNFTTYYYKIEFSTNTSPGDPQSYTLDSLNQTTYYIRVYTADEVPNWSPLSNGATAFPGAPGPGTVTLSASTIDGYIEGQDTGASPDADTWVRQTSSNDIPFYYYEVGGDGRWDRGFIEWDISSIPDDATITDVVFKYHGETNNASSLTYIYSMENQPSAQPDTTGSGGGNKTIYDDAANGNAYLSGSSTFPEIGESKQIDLGSTADSDLQSNLTTNWFAIGLKNDEGTAGQKDSIYSSEYSTANPSPTLYVNFTYAEDTTPPAAITNLSALTGDVVAQVKLTWTAPGDDGTSGDICSGKYRIKYSQDSNYDWNVSDYDIEWTTTTSPGESQSRVVENLTPGATYYFRIWTGDEIPNWSTISNSANAWAYIEDIDPSAITDLQAKRAAQILLSWTAPGDNGTEGQASFYNIRYSSSSPLDWDTATVWKSSRTTTGPYGTPETETITGLTPGTTYYFQIKAFDLCLNWSLSNQTTAQAGTFALVGEPMGPNKGLDWSSLAFGDYDNDGDLDPAVSGNDDSDYRRLILFKNTNGNFTEDQNPMGGTNKGVQWSSIAFGDYDNDGDLDLAVSGLDDLNNKRLILFKNTNGSFAEDQNPMGGTDKGVYASSLAFGDYDNDGDLDLAVSGTDGTYRRLILFKNNNGNFTLDQNPMGGPDKGVSQSSIAFGDYDNDGDLDLAVSGYDGTKYRLILFKNTNGTFTSDQNPMGETDKGVEEGSLAFGDYDNDGDLDLAVSGWDWYDYPRLILFKNNNGTFSEDQEPMGEKEGVYGSSLAFGDYDNDGDLDLAVSGYDYSDNRRLIIYKNMEAESGNANTLPGLPQNLTGLYNEGVIKLSWSSATDGGTNPTPQAGLYYNIRVGTGTEVSASSSVVTGIYGSPMMGNYLRPKLTNSQYGVRISSTGLTADTTYYWTVQTIDTPLNAGGWASLESVYVATVGTPQAPSAITNLSALTGDNEGEVKLSWTAPGDDGGTGDITDGRYGIKYATYTTYDFNGPSGFDLEWSTSTSPGNSESKVVTGLTAGTTYYLRIWTADEVLNWSGISNGATTWAARVAPAAITTLSALTGDYGGEVKLSWSAPGDDEWTGDIIDGRYGIKYATYTSYDFNGPSGFDLEWSTSTSPGNSESKVVTDLTEGVTYYFRIWTADEVLNWSGISNGATTWAKVENPSAITDLEARTAAQILLSWTAPGDDGTQGQASFYNIRYTDTSPFDWDTATVWKSSRATAGPYSTPETETITGLTPGTTYYFQIKAYDDCLNWSLSNQTTAQAGTFQEDQNPMGGTNKGVYWGSIAFGDYDNDGDLDLAVTGYDDLNNYRLILFKNNNGNFTSDQNPMGGTDKGVRWSSIAFGDYDNDGDLDLAVSGRDDLNNERLILFKNNNGNFTSDQNPMGGMDKGVRVSSIAFGDYDNDGDLDLAVSGYDDTNLRLILFKNNNGTFTEDQNPMGGTSGVWYGSLAFGDYDNDGDLDLAVSGDDGTNIRLILFKNTNGNFTSDQNPMGGTNKGVWYSSLAFGDYDNDGDLDLAVSGYDDSNNRRLILFKNDNGNFTSDQNPMGGTNKGVYCSSIAFGDYDNDGDLDLAVSGEDGTYRRLVLFKNNNGTFTSDQNPMGGTNKGVQYSSIAFGDYDNDGDLDLAVTGYDDSNRRLIIYENREAESGNANTLPGLPQNLTGLYNEGIIKLSWSSATDGGTSPTPQAGLYYNIRVGTGTEVSASSSVVTGIYGSPMMGNYLRPKLTDSVYGVRISSTGLTADTTYYWTVQAIDTPLNAGGWASLESLYVPSVGSPQAPSAITNLSALTGDNEGEVKLSWTAPGDDGGTGDITDGRYGIKYATYTTYDFNGPSGFDLEWSTNTSPGDSQAKVVTGLTGGTTYYLRIWTADDVLNWSGMSNGATTWAQALGDTTSPAAITNLTGLCDSDTGDVTLSWSTPGDDGWNNTLADGSKYRIDYSTYVIAWSTNTYDVEIPTHSVTPYTEVSHTITGLTGNCTYYFRIWTADEIPNWSGLSNGATAWVNSVLSVSISTDTINLGVVEPDSYALTVSSVVVTNNGNIKQKFKLKIVSEPNATWDSVTATSPGAEQYRFSGIFCSTQPVTSDFLSEDTFSVSAERTSSSTDLARDTDPDEQKGFNVSPDNTRNLWFKFEAPTSTDITTTQAIPVRIIAIPYP